MAGCPYGVPSAQLGHPEPRNGHAHLGYVLASGVQDTESTGDPQRFLARIQHGLTMALDADRAYTHRLTKTPTIPPGAHFGSALTPTSWGSYVTTLATVCRCVSHDWKRWGRGGTSRCSMACGSGHIEHGWATRIGTCGACLSLPR